MAAVPSSGRATGVEPPSVPLAADAAELLYQRYSRQIFNYCLHRLGKREEAEDAVQMTFLYAFRGLRRGVLPAVELAWLLKIARNVCLSRWHAARRRSRFEVARDPQALQDVVAGPERESDELIRLEEALARLPERQRRAILLREWQGLSYREIAEQLALSQAAVETLIFRARRALAQALSGDPAPKRRRSFARCVGLSSLLAVLKSALIGGSAFQLVAAVTALATGTVVATETLEHRWQRAPVPAAPPAVAPPSHPVDPAARSMRPEAAAGDARRRATRRLQGNRQPGPAHGAGRPLPRTPALSTEPLPGAGRIAGFRSDRDVEEGSAAA